MHFWLNFEFSENKISVGGYCEDPAGIVYPTLFRMGASIPASHDFGSEISFEERSRILKGWNVVCKPSSGNVRKYAYNASLSSLGGRTEKLSIDAPVYGKRKISFRTKKFEDTPMLAYIYSGNQPWQGYSVAMYKKDSTDRNNKIRLEINIR